MERYGWFGARRGGHVPAGAGPRSRRVRASFAPVLAVWVATLSACANRMSPVSRPDAGADAGGDITVVGPRTGELGGPCSSDADCASGLRCMATALAPSAPRYCTMPCVRPADCDPLRATTVTIGVPETFNQLGGDPVANQWGWNQLSRGVVCDAGYCRFLCPEWAGVTFGADGNTSGCNCFPNFRAAGDGCVWNADIECSALSYQPESLRARLPGRPGASCDACNSSTSFVDRFSCHTGVFGCNFIYPSRFEGECAEVASVEQLAACVRATTNFNCACDPACQGSCFAPTCIEVCCRCTQASGPPRAVCDGGVPPDARDSGAPPLDGCPGAGVEASAAACGDRADNDCDGFVDCADFDCQNAGFCPRDAGRPDARDAAVATDAPCVPSGAENTNATCGDRIDNDCDGFTDCVDFDCRRAAAVTVCPCVPSGAENTNATCGDRIDNDCNGFTDCVDFNCSRNAAVTVCPDAG